MSWRVRAAVAAAVLSVAAMTAARADEAAEGALEIRVRAIYLEPANDSDAYAPLAIPQDAVHINSKWLPDVDLEYFFTPHWSSELVLTYPQSQTVTIEKSALGGPTAIGSFKHLPPTLTLKYDFLPDQVFRPYVGVGVNLTLISDVNLNVPSVGPLTLDKSSVGFAAQAGFDLQLAPHWYANADIKWVQISSDVKFDGTRITTARIDPLLIGVGVGYRF